MAKNSATIATPAAEVVAPRIPVFVAGYKEHEGQIIVIFKDKVAKRKGVVAKGVERNGSCFMVKGFTIEEVKEEFQLNVDQRDLSWGEPREVNSKGEELTNVFEIEGL
jgi:trans-2-enoyl-CoA reductase